MKLNIPSIITSLCLSCNPMKHEYSYAFEYATTQRRMVVCDYDNPCPFGSKCIIVYGREGFCVLTE